MKFKKPYEKQPRKQTPINPESRTKQSFKNECDINNILAKYRRTGLIDHVNQFNGDYSDLTDVPTYQDAMNKIIQATDAFQSLPSDLRKKFNNDPQNFLTFVSDPQNLPELESMGLVPRQKPIEAPLQTAEGETPSPENKKE